MSGFDQLAVWSEQADRAAREGRWADAAGLLENIRSVDPGYPDLARRLPVAVARRQEQADARRQQLFELHERAGRAEAGGRVDEAIAALAQLVALDPANSDAARRLQDLRHAAVPSSQPRPSVVAGRPAPARGRARTWIIAAAAAAVVLALVVGTVLLRDRVASVVGGPSSTPTALPPSAEPSTASPTPTAGLTTVELRDHLPGDVGPTCEEYAPPVGDKLEVDLTGALRCELTDATAADTVWYLAYADAKALDVAVRPFAAGDFDAGDCRSENQRFVYSDTEPGEKVSGGVLLCYESEQGETYFVWTHDDLRVLSLAADPDLSFPEMRTWWEGAGPVR